MLRFIREARSRALERCDEVLAIEMTDGLGEPGLREAFERAYAGLGYSRSVVESG